MATESRAGRHADPAPVATYRLQLGREQDLDAAAGVVPYLAALGVSHLYLSPIFEAVPGSAHGYDGTDPTAVRGELGGRPALDRLRRALDDHGMGLLLDIVPNHLATHHANPLWWSVLAEGRGSDAAGVFDIDWSGGPHHPPGTVLLPVLGEPLDEAVAAGKLTVVDGEGGPALAYAEHRFPLRHGTLPAGGAPADTEGWHALLDRQCYRLALWRVAGEDMGYRRFFDVTTLIGVRVEDPAVFDRTQSLAIELVRSGVVQGLRVDHVDGLADPDGYLAALAARTDGAWVVVEKILEPDERLPSEWLVDGTTGYEGGALIGSVLTDPAGEGPLLALFQRRCGDDDTWPATVTEAKGEVLARLFRPELTRLTALFATALGGELSADLTAAIAALIISFDRYRLYPPDRGALAPADVAVLAEAAARARGLAPDHAELVDDLEHLLVADAGGEAGREARVRLNQVTGAVTAKGVEDTALYRWVALVANGDVGAPPSPLGLSLAAFHAAAEASSGWPQGLVATSTHDSKRSEDVRARLSLLGEVADDWAAAIERWSGSVTTTVDPTTQLVLWQTLVGAWPVGADRVHRHLEKSVREAKRHTSWTDRDDDYEQAVHRLVDDVFADQALLADVAGFVDRLLEPARVNALAQLLLKLTLPGIPDVYQGNELWRLDLTDPDNRRPVDFDARRALLATARSAAGAVWPDQDDGLAKLWLLHRALQVRRAHGDAFVGRYGPVPASGPAADHVVSYHRGGEVLVVVPRFPIALGRAGGWRDTVLSVPPGTWSDALGEGRDWEGEAALEDLLAPFPVALLVRTPGPASL